MALNYIVNFGDRLGTLYRIEIDNPDYTGDPIELIPSGTPLIISWEGNNDDDIFKTHVIPSNITIGVVSTGLDFDTLFYINDTSFKTRVYRAGVLYWSGYLISDGIQEVDSGIPFDVTLTAIDGLEFLDNNRFYWRGLGGRVIVDGVMAELRSPIHAYKDVLTPLSDLPIKWNSSLKNDYRPTSDMIAGGTVIDRYGDFYSLEKTSGWVIGEITKSAQSWLYQSEGKWVINRYFDADGCQINPVTTGNQTAVSVPVNTPTALLPTDVINESWYWSGKKPLGSVEVLYQSTREPSGNIVPNGDFSETSVGYFLYWGFTQNPGNGAFYDIYETSITEGGGNAADLRYPTASSSPTGIAVFSFNSYTSVDADKLFRDFLLSFTVMPLNGFTINTSTNIINWDNKPLKIKVEFITGGASFFLNEFGFWQRVPSSGGFLSMSTSSPNSKSIKFTFTGNPIAGNVISFQLRYIQFSNIRFSAGQYVVTENDENLGIAHMISNIGSVVLPQLNQTSSWTSTYNANSITFTNTASGADTVTNNDSYVNSNSSGIDEDGFMSVSAQGTAIGDVINFQFQGKGTNNSNILFPRGKGRVKVSFMLKEGQRYVLDNVRMTVGVANDVYTISSPSSPNSKENYQMGISSGYSGFMYSSYGNSYSDVYLNEYWNGGKTLTQLYGEAIMSVRNRPCRVFSGTIDRQMEWGLFSLMGHVYAPLSVRMNVKDMVTDVVGVEFAPSTPVGGYIVEHKSSEG